MSIIWPFNSDIKVIFAYFTVVSFAIYLLSYFSQLVSKTLIF